MTPDCRRVDERLLDFVYEELAPEERADVAAHIEACGRCSAELRSIGGTRAMLRALPEEEPSQAVTARLLHEAAVPRTLGGKLRAALSVFVLHPAWSLGAATAVVLLGSIVVFRHGEVPLPGERAELAEEKPRAHRLAGPAKPAPARDPRDEIAAAPQPPQTPSPSTTRLRKARSMAAEPPARRSDPVRKKSVPFAEMETRQFNASDTPMGALGSRSEGSGAGAPAAAAPPARARATQGDSLDDLLTGAAGSVATEKDEAARSPADELRRLADERRTRGDCPGALVLYRKLLRDYSKYPRRTEVERAIAACEAAKPAGGAPNK